jgi:hypothetical protein|tara:strand:- start:3582 stop:4133 length:552 start_codon:yes stop_codon:yes gene_type:complete
MVSNKEIWYSLAGFILDNKKIVIEWLNKNYQTSLKLNSSLKRVNEVVAFMMINQKDFISDIVKLQEQVEEGSYSGFVVVLAQVVSALGTMVGNLVQGAKNAVFGREQAARMEQYGKETEEYYKELAEIRANKEVAIKLGQAQTDIMLKREQEGNNQKRNNVLIIFGLFIVGAVSIYLIKGKNS